MDKPAKIFTFIIDDEKHSIYEDGSVDDYIRDRLKSKDGFLTIVNNYRAIQQEMLGQIIILKNKMDKV